MTYHQPTGTIHQEGGTTVYHWCNPNIIFYNTPSGIIYYDYRGMTYRGAAGLAHYAPDGEVLYQGFGGITDQKPDGSLTHWTSSGAIYRHADGSMSYTPVGESVSKPMPTDTLPPVPYPGDALSVEQVME